MLRKCRFGKHFLNNYFLIYLKKEESSTIYPVTGLPRSALPAVRQVTVPLDLKKAKEKRAPNYQFRCSLLLFNYYVQWSSTSCS